MSKRGGLFKIALPAFILALGFAGMQILILSRPPPKEHPPAPPGQLVEVIKMKPQTHQVVLQASGTVQPRRKASIIPQVGGKVVAISPQLVTGGYFRQGELLFAIDPIDYELALAQAQALVTQRELELARVESQARVARREWDRFEAGFEEKASPLVLYAPQLQSARANLSAARSSVRQAQVNLSRTRLTAPFNCRIQSENIEKGQVLQPGVSIATVTGTDTVEVIVPLAYEDLNWLFVPMKGHPGKGSDAVISLPPPQGEMYWEGTVDRSLGEVDSLGRMVRLAIRVDDPYHLKTQNPPSLALELGLFVDVKLRGRTLSGVFGVPRKALHNRSLWLADADLRLKIQPIGIAFRERETVWVDTGLNDGDMVILTRFSGAAERMKLRLAPKDNKP